MSGSEGTWSAPLPSTRARARIGSRPARRTVQLPVAASNSPPVTSCVETQVRARSYLATQRSRYARISAWGEKACDQSGLGSNENE